FSTTPAPSAGDRSERTVPRWASRPGAAVVGRPRRARSPGRGVAAASARSGSDARRTGSPTPRASAVLAPRPTPPWPSNPVPAPRASVPYAISHRLPAPWSYNIYGGPVFGVHFRDQPELSSSFQTHVTPLRYEFQEITGRRPVDKSAEARKLAMK